MVCDESAESIEESGVNRGARVLCKFNRNMDLIGNRLAFRLHAGGNDLQQAAPYIESGSGPTLEDL